MDSPARSGPADTSRPDDPSPPGRSLDDLDPWLAPYRDRIDARRARRRSTADLVLPGGLLGPATALHRRLGLHRGERDGRPGVWYREFAPAAYYLSLVGDFNGWDRDASPLDRGADGEWSCFVPDDGPTPLAHGDRVKVHVLTAAGGTDRLPTYVRRAVADGHPPHFVGVYWEPPGPYLWKTPPAAADGSAPWRPAGRGLVGSGLTVYEAHPGMASEEGKIGTFREFARDVLPRIKALGYDAVQLMAVAEHPYYGSFGYHVSNFFAVSSRFGTPDDFRHLVDAAHLSGLSVIIDLVHSHAVKNTLEGIASFDGTPYYLTHGGHRREHPAWDSLCFDYARPETVRFLLSNVRYWLEEYRIDGFRFDGVTSMLYLHHGLGKDFGSYDDYFGRDTDEDAVTYLSLAADLVKAVDPGAVAVGEDMSGMPGLARPTSEGGLGFDYRLAMGVPDYWIRLLERRDEEWSVVDMSRTLRNRRAHEKHLAYVESHDQALVGDKTTAFRLMDAEMYAKMDRASESLVVSRGIALHKMLRLVTYFLGGEGYLTFMGNEFGHPEWIDFPREGNGFSFHYARRQWGLADDPALRYGPLRAFDQAMVGLGPSYDIFAHDTEEYLADDGRKVLVACRGPVLAAFNFHPSESFADLHVPAPAPVRYSVVLDTDDPAFGGHGTADTSGGYPAAPAPMYGRPATARLYLPARTAQVLVTRGNCS